MPVENAVRGGCRAQATPPACMATLLDQGAEMLDLGLSDLALLGTCLDGAVVLTSNSGALVEGRGGYGPLQLCGGRFRSGDRRVSVRIDDSADLPVMRSAKGDEITVIARDGRVQHRILLADYEHQIARSLPVIPAAAPLPMTGRGNVIALAAVRSRRQNWHQMDSGGQVDDLICAGGDRLATLPLLGQSARRVRPGLLASFLQFLCDQKNAIQVTVPVDGLAQTLSGRIGPLHRLGPLIVCETPGGRFALEETAIRQIWVTRQGRRSCLELYGEDRRCIALLTGTDHSWPGYLEAFPGV